MTERQRKFSMLATMLLVAGLGGCATAPLQKDGMCEALQVFAESIDDSATHSVTLKTEWGAEPTKGCAREDSPPAVALCEYLIEHTSWEFMAVNVGRALQCLDVRFPKDPDRAYVETLAGSVRSNRPAFSRQNFEVRVDFNTAATADELPYLKISITRQPPE